MYRLASNLLNARALLAAACLISLLWLASRSHSHSLDDAWVLFAFSAFASLGFLLFGQQRFAQPVDNPAGDDERIA
jgi:4-amino-4-deoxy-L-arabinose transferase-like glycosyltransferase